MSEGKRGMGRSGVVVPVEDRAKAERNLLWREENRAALAAYAGEVAREGLALAAYRTF